MYRVNLCGCGVGIIADTGKLSRLVESGERLDCIFVSQGIQITQPIITATRNGRIVLLLQGGDKSTQQRDIEKAKQLLSGLED